MRSNVHDTHVRFRANAALIARAEQVAAKQGMSVSELMRAALRREVGIAA